MPLVSVVIPTRHRPKLVLRAIYSVLNQTYRELELIVVVDGPDAATVTAVQSVEDPRLQLVINPRSLTAAGARNTGADRAAGDWIAFLDDDGEWLPNKLERQMAFASGCGTALVSCLSRVVTPLAGLAMPAAMAGAVIAGAEPRARSASTRWWLSGPACATSGAENSRFRAGTVRSRRIGWASGR